MILPMPIKILEKLSGWDRLRVLSACVAVTALIAATDADIKGDVSLGLLYLFPLGITAALLPRPWVVAAAIAATALCEMYGPHPWGAGAFARVMTGGITFSAVGLFVSEAGPAP